MLAVIGMVGATALPELFTVQWGTEPFVRVVGYSAALGWAIFWMSVTLWAYEHRGRRRHARPDASLPSQSDDHAGMMTADADVRLAYQELLDAVDIGIMLCDCDGRYIAANSAIERILQIPRDYFMGKTPAEAFPMISTGRIMQQYARALAGEVVVGDEQSYYHTIWGGSKWLVTTYCPRRNGNGEIIGTLVLVRERTREKETEDALREAQRRFHDMLATMQEAAIIVDARGTLTFCNEYLLSHTGWHADELLGYEVFTRLVPPSMAAHLRELLGRLMSGDLSPVYHLSCPLCGRDGTESHYFWRTMVIYDVHGNPTGVVALGEPTAECAQR